jgi:hypothetical protein
LILLHSKIHPLDAKDPRSAVSAGERLELLRLLNRCWSHVPALLRRVDLRE